MRARTQAYVIITARESSAIMSEPIEETIRKLALQNAVFFKGTANPIAIVGKILGTHPEYRSKVAEITPSVDLDKLTVVFVITDFQKEG